jgi:hypothetical protein
VTVRLVFTTLRRGAINRATFDGKSCIRADQGRHRAARFTAVHALRHFYASALDAGRASRRSPSTWATPTRLHLRGLHPPHAVEREAGTPGIETCFGTSRSAPTSWARPEQRMPGCDSAAQSACAGENPAYRSTRPSPTRSGAPAGGSVWPATDEQGAGGGPLPGRRAGPGQPARTLRATSPPRRPPPVPRPGTAPQPRPTGCWLRQLHPLTVVGRGGPPSVRLPRQPTGPQ